MIDDIRNFQETLVVRLERQIFKELDQLARQSARAYLILFYRKLKASTIEPHIPRKNRFIVNRNTLEIQHPIISDVHHFGCGQKAIVSCSLVNSNFEAANLSDT